MSVDCLFVCLSYYGTNKGYKDFFCIGVPKHHIIVRLVILAIVFKADERFRYSSIDPAHPIRSSAAYSPAALSAGFGFALFGSLFEQGCSKLDPDAVES